MASGEIINGASPIIDSKPPLRTQAGGDQKFEPVPNKEQAARVVGRRKLAPGASPSLRRKTFQSLHNRLVFKQKLVPSSR